MKAKKYHPRKVMAAIAQARSQLNVLLTFSRTRHPDTLTDAEWNAIYAATEELSKAYASVFQRVPEPRFSTALYAAREAKKRAKQGHRKSRVAS